MGTQVEPGEPGLAELPYILDEGGIVRATLTYDGLTLYNEHGEAHVALFALKPDASEKILPSLTFYGEGGFRFALMLDPFFGTPLMLVDGESNSCLEDTGFWMPC